MGFALITFDGVVTKGFPRIVPKNIKGMEIFFSLKNDAGTAYNLSNKTAKLELNEIGKNTLAYMEILENIDLIGGKCKLLVQEDTFPTRGIFEGKIIVTGEDFKNVIPLGLIGVK